MHGGALNFIISHVNLLVTLPSPNQIMQYTIQIIKTHLLVLFPSLTSQRAYIHDNRKTKT
jgi:hypothetical protein